MAEIEINNRKNGTASNLGADMADIAFACECGACLESRLEELVRL